MAKLYVQLTSDKGGRHGSKTGNEHIDIELYHGNVRVRRLRFKLEPGTGGANWEIEDRTA